jgi:hypothetical protein
MPILIFLIILAVLALVIVISAASAADSWAAAQQAQAAIEAARAAKAAAVGQTSASLGLTAAVVFLVVLNIAAVGVIVWLILHIRKLQTQQPPAGRWLPGPNARWGRLADGQTTHSLPAADPMQQLVQLELLRYLRQLNAADQPVLPPRTDENNEPIW